VGRYPLWNMFVCEYRCQKHDAQDVMDIDLDKGRLIVFFAGLAALIVVEQLFKARKNSMPLFRRVALHATVAVINTVFVRVLVYVPMLLWIVYVEQMGWGLARWLNLHGWLEFVISIIVLDAFDYFWHRANHRVPFFWRFHKTHHMDNDLDVFTALRFHPGELIISTLVKAFWVVIWGPSVIAWFLFEVLVSLCAQMHHSNVDLPDTIERLFARILVTPRFHTAHHLVDRRFGDKNFSTIFSFWDPIFGSLAEQLPREQIRAKPIGLPEARDQTLSLLQLLSEPFNTRNLNLMDDRKNLG
jgi:sterol desaturase/sphingolipid hydroxylase (fatty acid hydroxylase superfamily)